MLKNTIFKKMKLKHRMVVVYIIGGVLPIILLFIIMNNNNKNALVKQTIDIENERLEAEANEIMTSMDMAVELSEKFYYNIGEYKLGIKNYDTEETLEADYHDIKYILEYINKNYSDIYNISVYLYPELTENVKVIDNMYFRLITPTIQAKQWYINTIKNTGGPTWSYFTDIPTEKRSLRLTRRLFSPDGEAAGIVSITLKSSIAGDYIINKDNDFSLMVLNDSDIVYTNNKISDDELAYIIKEVKKSYFDGWIIFRDEQCVVSGFSLVPRFSNDEYYLISMTKYSDVVSRSNKEALKGFIPMLGGLFIAILSITMLSVWFTKRINSLVEAMHRVSEGKLNEIEDTKIEETEDEIYELYTDLKKMVEDMQKLTEDAANERVMKEQLYSRQKDVEFKMLATQINPHFLYNTLENIRMIASINKENEIADMSFTLTKILRKCLSAGQEMKPLGWEIDLIESYIKIQNYRFGDRIEAKVYYDKEVLDKFYMIPFVIQPFVENAYVHSMEDMDEGGKIEVWVYVSDSLNFVIQDNGCGMSEEKLDEVTRYLNDFEKLDRTHIGICNVHQRIKMKYGDEYGVNFISKENEGTRVEIKMPLVEQPY